MPWSMLTKTRAFIRVKSKVAGYEKRNKKYYTLVFPYTINMPNFLEHFRLSTNLFFLKGVFFSFDGMVKQLLLLEYCVKYMSHLTDL